MTIHATFVTLRVKRCGTPVWGGLVSCNLRGSWSERRSLGRFKSFQYLLAQYRRRERLLREEPRRITCLGRRFHAKENAVSDCMLYAYKNPSTKVAQKTAFTRARGETKAEGERRKAWVDAAIAGRACEEAKACWGSVAMSVLPRSPVRGPMSKVQSPKSDVRSPRSGVRGGKPALSLHSTSAVVTAGPRSPRDDDIATDAVTVGAG